MESATAPPEYDVDLPEGGAGDGATGDETSRRTDTSRPASTGAPNARPEGDGRPGSQSPAGGDQTGAGAQVPSGLLRDANRQIRTLQRQLRQFQSQQPPQRQPQQQQQPPPREEDLDPETIAIREQMFKVLPSLRRLERLDPDKFDQLFEMVNNDVAPRSQSLEKLYWQRNANTHLREINTMAREVYGEKVDPRAVRRFQAGFIDWIETDEDARERYLDGDPTLVKDYWTETTGLIIDPIRSKASDEAISRAERVSRLPKFPQRGGPVGAPRRNEKKPKTEDELHDQAWDALLERASAVR